jgi:PD-(D/E)XK nuclease superfamily
MARVTPTAQQPPRTPREDFGPKVQAHQRYYLEDGTQVPGVTTVLSVLDKPYLVAWANKMGLQGIDSRKYTDEAATVGTLAHYLVECELAGVEPELGDFTPNQIDRAGHSFSHFQQWRAQHDLSPVLVEAQLVSERYRYGGTVDCVAWFDEDLTLLDFKTSSGIYEEMKWQVSAYMALAAEHGQRCTGARILRIPRNDSDGLLEHVLSRSELETGWHIFSHALSIYRLKKKAAPR